ncbi:MAG: tetratricopeptide repeat protein, partial [Methanothrix sp.]
ALSGLGSIDVQKGNYQAAHENFEKCLRIVQQIGDQEIEASTQYQLAMIDLRKGDYHAARKKFEKTIKISQKIGVQSLESDCWLSLATIDSKQGYYEAAQKKFDKSMTIKHQIGDWIGEAVIWHDLASNDLRKGEYKAAHKNFEKSLKITQRIGNREGEAATFHQLGILSGDIGRIQEGLRLVAISFLINNSIRHEKAQLSFKNLSAMASQLKYTQESFDAMLKEVTESYARDRGWSLIRAAFPES